MGKKWDILKNDFHVVVHRHENGVPHAIVDVWGIDEPGYKECRSCRKRVPDHMVKTAKVLNGIQNPEEKN